MLLLGLTIIVISLSAATAVSTSDGVFATAVDFDTPRTTVCNSTLFPDTPQGLKIVTGDATATLSWSLPSNGACVEYYNVSWSQIQPQGDKGPLFQTKTPDTGLTLSNLDNGIQYAFYVEAVGKKANRTRPALATAIPQASCDNTITPTQPTNVTAYSDGPGIRICWKSPRGPGCVSEYRIARRLFPLTEEEARTVQWQYTQAKTAGCLTIPGLLDRRTYQLAVQSYSPSSRSGGYASTQATVVRDWKCMPVPSFYPLCTAAKIGGCNPMTCLDQLNAKRCDSPWLRRLDKATKTVVQYCSELCGCAIDDAIANEVTKMDDSGNDDMFFDQANGCCKF